MKPGIKPGLKKHTVGQRALGGRIPQEALQILDRGLDSPTPITRKRYTNKRKLEILRLKNTAWVPNPVYGHDAVRKPTWSEMERWIGVSENTATKWPRKEMEILEGRENDRQNVNHHYLPTSDPLWDQAARAHASGAIQTPPNSRAFWWSSKAWEN
jgi:hypothetical protein